MNIWLIGAGPHVREYATVLQHLGIDFEVVGRGEASAHTFEAATRSVVRRGGFRCPIAESGAPAQFIVAPSFEQREHGTIYSEMAGYERMSFDA